MTHLFDSFIFNHSDYASLNFPIISELCLCSSVIGIGCKQTLLFHCTLYINIVDNTHIVNWYDITFITCPCTFSYRHILYKYVLCVLILLFRLEYAFVNVLRSCFFHLQFQYIFVLLINLTCRICHLPSGHARRSGNFVIFGPQFLVHTVNIHVVYNHALLYFAHCSTSMMHGLFDALFGPLCAHRAGPM